jgi:succinate dehydrogenase/fumarate reductase flavoprotein subunit
MSTASEADQRYREAEQERFAAHLRMHGGLPCAAIVLEFAARQEDPVRVLRLAHEAEALVFALERA